MIFLMAATGGVGQTTIHSLISQGVPASQIIAGARDVRKRGGLPGDVEIRRADYQDRASLDAAFHGVQTLVLIPTKTMPPARCVEHGNALEAAKAAGVERVVFLSLQAATPLSRFIVAPFILFAECATRLSGLKWAIARMSLYSDPIAEWIPELVRMGRLPYPLVNARIAYIARDDVGRGLAAMARDGNLNGEIVEFTGPESVSMPELAAAVSKVTGVQIPFATITDAEYRDLCRQEKLPEDIIEILTTMYHAAEAQEFSGVTSDIESLTGKRAETVTEALARLK